MQMHSNPECTQDEKNNSKTASNKNMALDASKASIGHLLLNAGNETVRVAAEKQSDNIAPPTSAFHNSLMSVNQPQTFEPPSFTTLPPELLCQILSYLDTHSLRSVSSTCCILNLAAIPVMWANPQLPSYPLTPHEPFLKRYGNHIRSLSFPDPTYIDLEHVAPHIPGLLRVDLGGCAPFSVGDRQVLAIISYCPRLMAIDLRDCIDITDEALFALTKHPNIARLEELCLARCCEITDDGVIAIAKVAKGLKRLDLTCVPCLTDTSLKEVAKGCKYLTELTARDCDAVTDEALAEIARGCPKLERLDVDDCLAVTEKGFLEFARIRRARVMEDARDVYSQAVENLSSLSLNNVSADAVTDNTLMALLPATAPTARRRGNVGNLIDLDTLELAHASSLTEGLFGHVTKYYPGQLTRLNLSFVTIPSTEADAASDILAAFIKSQPFIHHLNLMGAVDLVSDATCLQIAESLTDLQTLDLSECGALTDEGTVAIARKCTKLVDVNLKGCTEIGDSTVKAFVDNGASTLRLLNLGLCNKLTDQSVGSLAKLYDKPDAGLHTLKLSGCFNLTDAALESFIEVTPESRPLATIGLSTDKIPLPNLALLCLSGCYHISDSSLGRLALRLPNLESINFYSCEGVTDATVVTIAQNCPRVQSLVMSKTRVGDIGFQAVGKCLKRLHTLYAGFLASDGPSDEGIQAVLDGCRELKLMDISRSERITDGAFKGGQMLQLQVVLLRCCPRLTVEGALGLIEKCPRVQKVDTVGCVGIGVDERGRIRDAVDGRW